MTALRTLIWVLRNRRLRRIEFAIAVLAVCEHGTWIAITVEAYSRGGVTEAGVVAFAQLMVAAVVAPVAAAVADRFRSDRVLTATFVLQALTFGVTGAVLASEGPSILVYVAAASAAAAVTLSRPATAAVLPLMVDTPTELTAANVVASLAEHAGLFVGPAGAGLLLATADSGVVFSGSALLMAVMVLFSLRVDVGSTLGTDDPDEEGTGFERALRGVALVRADARIRTLVIMMTLIAFLDGAADVAFVVVAVELLGEPEALAGGFATVVGIGGAVGASGAVLLIGRRRLTLPLTIGVGASGMAIAAVASAPPLVLLLALFACYGAGSALVLIAGRTMLQGLSESDVVARTFGVVEGLSMVGLAFGGLGFATASALVGPRSALVLCGLALPLVLVVFIRRLLEIDAARPAVDESLLRFARSVPIFAPLPPYALEQLISSFASGRYGPGETLMTVGERGNRFHLITDGWVEVVLPNEGARSDRTATGPVGRITRHPGEYVGEIALLRDTPRTATVIAGPEGATTVTLERDAFVTAVSSHGRSRRRADATVEARIDETRRSTG